MTETLKLDPNHLDHTILIRAAELIRAGEVVAFPTETVYGLGANALDAAAVDKIFTAKGRPTNDPIIVHISDLVQLAQITPLPISPLAHSLTQRFFPGALTLILPRADHIPPNVSANLSTIGVRMPSHPIARALIAAAGVPIAAPSANLFGHTSPTTAAHVYADLNGRIPLILDGGKSQVGVESTILDLTGDVPRLLRHGGIAQAALQAALRAAGLPEQVEVVRRFATEDEIIAAPGMLLRHYAPHTPLTLLQGSDVAIQAAMRRLAREYLPNRIGLLIADEDQAAVAELPNVVAISVGSLHNLDGVAHRLFAALRDLDTAAVTMIYARMFPEDGIGAAIRDRLTRAAESRIIQANAQN